MLLFYCGCAWAADAVEMMLLSFLGPAVSSSPGCMHNRPAQLKYYWKPSETLLSFCRKRNRCSASLQAAAHPGKGAGCMTAMASMNAQEARCKCAGEVHVAYHP